MDKEIQDELNRIASKHIRANFPKGKTMFNVNRIIDGVRNDAKVIIYENFIVDEKILKETLDELNYKKITRLSDDVYTT